MRDCDDSFTVGCPAPRLNLDFHKNLYHTCVREAQTNRYTE